LCANDSKSSIYSNSILNTFTSKIKIVYALFFFGLYLNSSILFRSWISWSSVLLDYLFYGFSGIYSIDYFIYSYSKNYGEKLFNQANQAKRLGYFFKSGIFLFNEAINLPSFSSGLSPPDIY